LHINHILIKLILIHIKLILEKLRIQPVSKLDQKHTGRLRKRDNLLKGEGGGDRRGAKSYDGEKAWSSINHSVLSVS
jgi:hypothetical protein